MNYKLTKMIDLIRDGNGYKVFKVTMDLITGLVELSCYKADIVNKKKKKKA